MVASEQCPWCGSVITHEQFVKIERAIREDEKRKLTAVEKDLRARVEKEVAARLSAKEQQLATDRKALETDRAKVGEERRSLAAMTKQQVELAKQNAQNQHQKEILALREVLAKDKDDALLIKDAGFAREREGLKKTVLELSRRVEQKAAGEIGEGAEINLFESLRAEFAADKITRIQKGKPGGDILHDVQHKGESCGKILIDSKNRNAWNGSFVKKLRQDQTDAHADHAILSTTVFPAGKKELFIDAGVIVVSPARAVIIVDLLRKFMVDMHTAKLGNAERATKLTRLYAFMTSTEFTQKLGEAEHLATDALQIEVDEKRAHDTIWKKRGAVLMRMKHVLREIDTEISAIIEAREASPIAAMTARLAEH